MRKVIGKIKIDGIGYFIAMLALTFFSAAVFSFMVLSFFGYLSKKSQEKTNNRLDGKSGQTGNEQKIRSSEQGTS